MAKTTDTQTSNTKYKLSPEQQKIMSSAMSTYMPGGNLPTTTPNFDYNSNPALQSKGQQYVAPFSEPTKQAFAATQANFGAQQPTMDAAKGMTFASGGRAGQFQGAPDGWSTDGNGQAQYQDFDTGVNRYMNPYVSGVIDNGLGFLDTARQRANLDTTNNSIAKKSFGGTRQAVRQSLNDAGFAAQSQNLISTNLNAGFDKAQSQYNTGFGQGQQALGYNTGVAQADRAALGQAGKQLGDQASQNQQIVGNDINALANVGSAIEGNDQAQRDAARADQMGSSTYGLSIAQALAGLAPPPSSTTNASQGVTLGSALGTAGSAGLNAAAVYFSDERAKTKVSDADPEDSLAEIRKLKPKAFEYTDHARSVGAPDGRRAGFMAQDMEKATGRPSPQLPGGYKGVDIPAHLGRLTQAIQALDAKMAKYSKKAA